MTGAYVISPCTMSRSTASFAAATSSSCACRLPRRRRTASDGHRSAEDRPTRAVRDDRTGPRRAHGLAEAGLAVERLAVPEPEPRWGEHITKGHYGSLVDDWLALGGLDPANHGTHSLRRTKVALVYQRTGNLRAPPLLSHPKLDGAMECSGRQPRLARSATGCVGANGNLQRMRSPHSVSSARDFALLSRREALDWALSAGRRASRIGLCTARTPFGARSARRDRPRAPCTVSASASSCELEGSARSMRPGRYAASGFGPEVVDRA